VARPTLLIAAALLLPLPAYAAPEAAPAATAPIPVTAPATVATQPQPPGATTAGQPATPPAAAVPDQRPPQIVMPVAPAPGAGSLLQTILALILVLAVLLGLAWALKRFGPRGMMGSANVKLVGALNIGGRERIMVVEVGDQWIVVGASPGRVNALATMPRREGMQLAGDHATLAGHAPPHASFSDWLKNTIDKRNAK
jgi:flagellar protein FliO/FliZ